MAASQNPLQQLLLIEMDTGGGKDSELCSSHGCKCKSGIKVTLSNKPMVCPGSHKHTDGAAGGAGILPELTSTVLEEAG